jgi:hypothetical protein
VAKISTTLVAAGMAVTAILGVAGTAGANPVQRPIGPDQGFVGLVNDSTTHATVQVLCPGGPIRVGERGHPVAGQTIGVSDVEATTAVSVGFTGSLGRSIVASFTPATSTAAPGSVTFTRYGDEALPASLSLPCYGSATVLFVPRPTSPTARPSKVSVTFVATCGSPVCPVVRSTRPRI